MQFLLLLAALKRFLLYIVLCLSALFVFSKSEAQYFKLQGVVYDSTRTSQMPGVTVLTTSGKGTSTDNNGRYEIDVKETDSVWFSYLNKPTVKFPVSKIFDAGHFDIALHINIPVLKEVVIRPRDYRMDSIQNRIDYAKAFNWEKPKLRASSVTSPYGASVGFDINEIIRMFQFRKNKSMAAFQQRLLNEEREKFIDHRFSKALVLRLTGLTGTARDSFMVIYRPDFEFCIQTPEYEFQAWIKLCYEEFKSGKARSELRKEH